jgi:selenocysteine lyase/cysteine desulfurase
MWVTWGQARWGTSARRYEDYGTRDLPEVLSLGDAFTFQTGLGEHRKEVRYRELFAGLRDAVDASPNLTWRSPRSWESGGILTAIGLALGNATEVSDRLFREKGIVVRPFPQAELNALRVSPNLMNGEEELMSLLQALERQVDRP